MSDQPETLEAEVVGGIEKAEPEPLEIISKAEQERKPGVSLELPHVLQEKVRPWKAKPKEVDRKKKVDPVVGLVKRVESENRVKKFGMKTWPDKRAEGRVDRFGGEEGMQKVVDEYYRYCDERQIMVQNEDHKGNIQELSVNKPEPYTVGGLCLALGFPSLDSLKKWLKVFPGYIETIERAITKIQAQTEVYCIENKNPAGVIFLLKARHGFQEKDKLDITHHGEISLQMVLGAAREKGGEKSVWGPSRKKKGLPA